MAADLHDRLACSCGCGQWEKDAHDPEKKDQWHVWHDVCYVRRSIDAYVKAADPPNEAVISVRLLAPGEDAARSDYEDIIARFPERFGKSATTSGADAEVDASGDDADRDGEQHKQD